MSLIDCYECQGKVSEIAAACPKCGAPVVSDIKTQAINTSAMRNLAGLLFFGPIAWLVLTAWLEGPAAVGRDFVVSGSIMAVGVAFYLVGEIARNIDEAKLRKRRQNT